MQTHTRTKMSIFKYSPKKKRTKYKSQSESKAKKKRITILPNNLNECDHARVSLCMRVFVCVYVYVSRSHCTAHEMFEMRNAKKKNSITLSHIGLGKCVRTANQLNERNKKIWLKTLWMSVRSCLCAFVYRNCCCWSTNVLYAKR